MTRLDHVIHTLHAEHVSNLVRVGYNADGTVAHGNTCEFVRHHHTTLNMYMAVNETWHQIRPRLTSWGKLAMTDFNDLPVLHDQ